MITTASRLSREDLKTFALPALAQLKAQAEEWEELAADDKRHGYRPRRCWHGTSQWSDYDVICGPCEDFGYYPTPDVLYRLALDKAHHKVNIRDEAMAALVTLNSMKFVSLDEAITIGKRIGAMTPVQREW